jgi:hypothetical protein
LQGGQFLKQYEEQSKQGTGQVKRKAQGHPLFIEKCQDFHLFLLFGFPLTDKLLGCCLGLASDFFYREEVRSWLCDPFYIGFVNTFPCLPNSELSDSDCEIMAEECHAWFGIQLDHLIESDWLSAIHRPLSDCKGLASSCSLSLVLDACNFLLVAVFFIFT